MSKEKYLIGNWKMNHTQKETKQFLEDVASLNLVENAKEKDVVLAVAPSYLSLQVAKKNAHGIIIASQDAHHKDHGAYTSSVSIPMLQEIKIDWSIIGHSERRGYEGETSEICNQKIVALLANKFHIVYCVGETEKEYEAGKTKNIIKKQVTVGLSNVAKEDVKNIIIAYEPVWSIGTGKNASKEIAEDICSFIRGIVEKLYDKETADNLAILYGGSVKPENIHDYLLQENVDGALVGGASLKADSFKSLLDNI